MNIENYLKKIYELLSISTDRTNMALKTAPTIVKPDALSTGFRVTTFDYGDKTTWYQNANEIKKGVITIDTAKSDAANNTYVFKVSDTALINIESPRLSAPHRYLRTYEDATFIGGLLMADGTFKSHSDFYIKVYKNDVDITSHVSNIDHLNGELTTTNVDFLDNDVVTADYWCLPTTNASQFILRPYGNVKWFMRHVEMQLSISVSYMPTVVFEMWGGNADYAYDFDDPTQRAMHVGYEMRYRSGIDYINVGNEGKGLITKHYNLTSDIMVFPFNYDRALDVGSDNLGVGKLIRIRSLNDEEYEGTEICTTSFYIEQRRNVL